MALPAPRLPALLAGAALLLVLPLVAWNLRPQLFTAGAHERLAPLPLAVIALASLIHQLRRRPRGRRLLSALLLSAGFSLWAANMLLPQALLLNDLAIVVFVTDLFLIIACDA
jgi:hypothetical protein